MANANNPRSSGSLVRRLAAPLGLAAAVLGGGGWGVYQYTTGPTPETESLPSATAHSDSPAKEELKNLFATDSVTDSKTSAKSGTVRPENTDRYARQSTPAPNASEQNRSALTPAKSVNPFATAPALPSEIETDPIAPRRDEPAPKAQDRYADYSTPTPPAPSSLAPTPAALEAEESAAVAANDVTRGQEPSANPLRSPRQEQDARSAFAAEPPIATAVQTTDRMANALNNALPLQPNAAGERVKKRTADTNSRYPSGTPPLANSSAAIFDKSEGLVMPGQRAPEVAQERPQPTIAPQSSPAPQDYPVQSSPPSPPNNLSGPASVSSNRTPTPGLVNNPGTGRPGERLLEGMQNPSITIQKLSPEEIQVGRRCTFAIRVQNTGQRTAQDVRIHDEIPLGTELVGTAPRASVSGSQVVWELGTLSVGEERTVEMELVPTEEGELGSVATVLVATQASAKSRCTRPELALRLSSSKPQVLMGEQQLVQIEISNPGSGDATGVMLLESVPTGVSHEAGPTLEFEIGTLRAGESRRLELVLFAEKAGKIQNVMTARADASLQVEASCEFEVIAPELRLSIEGPQKRYLERPATYQVSVDNPGTATAREVQLVTHLPKGLQFVSANNMGEYDSALHTVTWSLAELPAKERGTVELIALPIEPGAQTLQVATTAKQGLEDRTEKEVMVEGLAALMFEVADLADPIEIGGETTYEIRVVNQGSKAAENVQVVAILPPGLRALSGQGETRHTIQGERVEFAPIPSLGPKADASYRIQVQGTRPGDQRLRVQLTTDDVQQPITKEESTHVYADE